MFRVALFLCAALFAGSAEATLRGSNGLAASMQPDVVAHLLSEVEHTWEKTALAALMGKESEANAVQQMKQSCQKVAKSIIDGSDGDKERIMEYMSEVCSASKEDKKVCDEFSAHIDAVVTHDAYHNREELDLAAFCGSFYQGSVVERAKKQQQVLQVQAAEQKKQEEAKAAEQAKQAEAKALEEHRAKAAERQKVVATAEKEAEAGATAMKEAEATAAGIEKDGDNVKALVERAQKALQTADEKDVAAAEAQAAQAAADAAAKRAEVAARKAEEAKAAVAAKKKAVEKKAEKKQADEKKVEEKKVEEKKAVATPEKKPAVAALAVRNRHCPKCGSLVCPHGFTAEESEGHCCPYCVNPAISTEVVKDPAYYAEKAAPVYKKFR